MADRIEPPLADVESPQSDDEVRGESERLVIENNLIRALLEYATDIVQVQLKREGEEQVQSLDVPFAELVIHRLEEEGIELHGKLNMTVIKRFSEALDEERILLRAPCQRCEHRNSAESGRGACPSACVEPQLVSTSQKIYPVDGA